MIFGTQPPKIKYSNGSEFKFEYAVTEYNWDSKINVVEHKDVFTGNLSHDYISSYSDFVITVNLYKYDDFPTKVAKWNELSSLLFSKVSEFYPHADGSAVKDSKGNPITYFVESVDCGQGVSDMNNYDTVTLKLKPLS